MLKGQKLRTPKEIHTVKGLAVLKGSPGCLCNIKTQQGLINQKYMLRIKVGLKRYFLKPIQAVTY